RPRATLATAHELTGPPLAATTESADPVDQVPALSFFCRQTFLQTAGWQKNEIRALCPPCHVDEDLAHRAGLDGGMGVGGSLEGKPVQRQPGFLPDSQRPGGHSVRDRLDGS